MIRLVERLIYPLFFVTVVLGLSYWYWTTTPTYALSQIIGAVKNKDGETFEKYVDVESIAYRAIDDVLHGPARESGMFGNFDSMIGVGIIGLFKPEIAEIAKTQALKFVESGQLVGALKDSSRKNPAITSEPSSPATTAAATDHELTHQSAGSEHASESDGTHANHRSGDGDENLPHTAPKVDMANEIKHHGLPDNSTVSRYAKKLKVGEQLKAYGLSKQGFKGIDYLKIDGPTALIGFKFHSDKFARDIIVEIKMEDAGGYWRVTELSNLNTLISTYLETRNKLESSMLSLPAPTNAYVISRVRLITCEPHFSKA